MTIQPIDRAHAPQAIALLRELNVSLYGIQSPAIHSALVDDGLKGRNDFQVAVEGGEAVGLVVAAPASYRLSFLLRHWVVALSCVWSRVVDRASPSRPNDPGTTLRKDVEPVENSAPPRSWARPGDAWRIIFVGTHPRARGRGIGARLYQAVMAERSLVARIAADNTASLRLHRSLGWRLFEDGDVVLAVFLRGEHVTDLRAPHVERKAREASKAAS